MPAGELVPKYWVFGTELPHVVLSEVLAEYQDPPVVTGTPPAPTTVRVWAELHNPFQTPDGQQLHPQDGFPVRLLSDASSTALTRLMRGR